MAANEELDDSMTESDEETGESRPDSYRVNENEANNFRLKFDRINIEKLNKIDGDGDTQDGLANSKELDKPADENGKANNEQDKNQLNANQLKRGLNEIIDGSDEEDVSRFSKRDVINKVNKSDKLAATQASASLQDSETHLGNQINNQFDVERVRKASESGALIEQKTGNGQTGSELTVRANGAPDDPNKVRNGLADSLVNNNRISNEAGSSLASGLTDHQTSAGQISNPIGNQIKNQFSPTNGQTASQSNSNKQPDNRIKSSPLAAKTLSSYFNSRLKARHVASGDQLRIMRREGQPLRLSCLPAFHAPSRSTVNWFKNGDVIKVSV